MGRLERLKRREEVARFGIEAYGKYGFKGRPESPHGFGGVFTESGETGEFRGVYGPFLERYFRAETSEEKEKILVKELNKMVYGKGIPKEQAVKILAQKLENAKKRMESQGEYF